MPSIFRPKRDFQLKMLTRITSGEVMEEKIKRNEHGEERSIVPKPVQFHC